MANEASAEAVIDQPSVAVRAREPMAARVAERQRRKAAPIEEQQRLLAAFERNLHGFREAGRDIAAARRAFAPQVDGLDHR